MKVMCEVLPCLLAVFTFSAKFDPMSRSLLMTRFGTLLLALLFAAPVTLLAQAPDVTFGETVKSDKRGYKITVLGVNSGTTYVLRKEIPGMGANAFSTPKLYFETYNDQLKRTKEGFVDLENGSNDYDYETSFYSGGQLWLVTSLLERKADKRTFYLQRVDPVSLKADKRQAVGRSNGTTTLQRMAGQNFSWAGSQSGKRLAVIAINRDQKAPEQFAIQVFDESLNSLWERKVRMREIDKDIDHRQILVDDLGGVYLLLEVEKNDETNYRAVYYADADAKPVVFEFDVANLLPADMAVQLKEPGILTAVGSYADPVRGGTSERWRRIKGFFYAEVDIQAGEYIKEQQSDFSNEFLTAHLSDRQAEKAVKKDKQNARRFDVRDIIQLADGGMLVLGEQFTSVITTQYVYMKVYDIVAFRLDAEGKLIWAERVAKEQEMAYRHGGGIVGTIMASKFTPRNIREFMRSDMDMDNIYSFGYSMVGDKLWVMFNDDPKNLEDPDERRVLRAGSKKMYLVGVSMDLATGQQTKELLFDARQEDRRGRPAMGAQSGPNEYLFFSSWKKDLEPVRVSW